MPISWQRSDPLLTLSSSFRPCWTRRILRSLKRRRKPVQSSTIKTAKVAFPGSFPSPENPSGENDENDEFVGGRPISDVGGGRSNRYRSLAEDRWDRPTSESPRKKTLSTDDSNAGWKFQRLQSSRWVRRLRRQRNATPSSEWWVGGGGERKEEGGGTTSLSKVLSN